ncbi:MAG: aminomethyl-transferring glycine dehydrogenase [Phycisphaerales bacterium JB040]
MTMTDAMEHGAETSESGGGGAGHLGLLRPTDRFVDRHIGPDAAECAEMLRAIGCPDMGRLLDEVVPADIRSGRDLDLPKAMTEERAVASIRTHAGKNRVFRSCLGMGYHGTVTPAVILRNVMENPGWYTQYTPYQAELSQGRLEALLNFQTMVADLTGLELCGASLLDEGTAAAEAMAMCVGIAGNKRHAFFVAEDCHPQTIEVVRTRAESVGIELIVGPADSVDVTDANLAGLLVQYPTTDGRIECYRDLATKAHEHGVTVVAAADLLSLTLFTPPGEWGADICVGSAQRFGVPMGLGGPHAAFLSTSEKHVRRMPGRLVGVSKDAHGDPALRLAIQTREQHIKRDRATSNICTAQVLLAIMASMYGVYHGPDGLTRIARRIRAHTQSLRAGLLNLGHAVSDSREGGDLVFDTLRVRPAGRGAAEVIRAAAEREINLRDFGDGSVGVTLDETCDWPLVRDLLWAFGGTGLEEPEQLAPSLDIPEAFERTSPFMTHSVFNTHRSETEMLRYLTKLQSRDLSLAHSMIPLGSCTMKLNATAEMVPVTWPEFGGIHPFAPREQWAGYSALFEELERWLAEITGFAAVSLQPNAGSQGEYAGLMTIRAYHASRGESHRDVCLIPESAHGTNPASAVVAGMRVVGVKVSETGAIDLADLRAKAEQHADRLAACMITYPSTCGVFDDRVREFCEVVHASGGLVYMDGANMNAQVGLTSPAACGADVCHLNLHKTFCIPHGGGGPGMGPIGVNERLRPFLMTHPVVRPESAGERAVGPISAAPYGSASILPISWMYIAMMGPDGLRRASEVAILSANYMAERLKDHYDVLFRGSKGRVAHEFVIDCREFKKSAGIEIDDIAKRLIDYGFHAPTMSWPVPGTLMIEPTESESKAELDRFCDAMIAIRGEIAEIERGEADREDNVLKGAPHSIKAVGSDGWGHPYTRERAAWPVAWLRDAKFWPFVGRVDNPYGDRNLVCSCVGMDEYASSSG